VASVRPWRSAPQFAIVTDEDIDIHDRDQLDRASIFRVQADRDVINVSDARGKHVDPSIRGWDGSMAGVPARPGARCGPAALKRDEDGSCIL
jgi:UbiD family decarboxylase